MSNLKNLFARFSTLALVAVVITLSAGCPAPTQDTFTSVVITVNVSTDTPLADEEPLPELTNVSLSDCAPNVEEGLSEYTLAPRDTEDGTASFGTRHDDAAAVPADNCELRFSPPDGWEVQNAPQTIDILDSSVNTQIVVLRRVESDLEGLTNGLKECLDENDTGLIALTRELEVSTSCFIGTCPEMIQVSASELRADKNNAEQKLAQCQLRYDDLTKEVAANPNDVNLEAAQMELDRSFSPDPDSQEEQGAFIDAQSAIDVADDLLRSVQEEIPPDIAGLTQIMDEKTGDLTTANTALTTANTAADCADLDPVTAARTGVLTAQQSVAGFALVLEGALANPLIEDDHPDREAAETALEEANTALVAAAAALTTADDIRFQCSLEEAISNIDVGDQNPQANLLLNARDENGVLLATIDVTIPVPGSDVDPDDDIEDIEFLGCNVPCPVNYDLDLGDVDLVVEATGFQSKLLSHSPENSQVSVINFPMFTQPANGQLFAPLGSIRLDLDTTFDLAGNGLFVTQNQDGTGLQVPAACAITDGDTATATIATDCSSITTGSLAGCVRFTATYDQFDADGDGAGDTFQVSFDVRVTDGPEGSPETCF